MTCEGVLFTPPVGCSRLPSAVNDLATTNSKQNELHQCSFHCHHNVLEEEEDATSDIDKEESVQVALIQTHGGDGAYLQVLLGSLIGVSSVHSCLICSVRYTIFPISLVLLRGWAIGVIFLCQLVHLDALLLGQANFELRSTIQWISLKAIVNSIKILFDTSPPRIVGTEMPFLCLSFAVPSTTRSPLFNDVVRD